MKPPTRHQPSGVVSERSSRPLHDSAARPPSGGSVTSGAGSVIVQSPRGVPRPGFVLAVHHGRAGLRSRIRSAPLHRHPAGCRRREATRSGARSRPGDTRRSDRRLLPGTRILPQRGRLRSRRVGRRSPIGPIVRLPADLGCPRGWHSVPIGSPSPEPNSRADADRNRVLRLHRASRRSASGRQRRRGEHRHRRGMRAAEWHSRVPSDARRASAGRPPPREPPIGPLHDTHRLVRFGRPCMPRSGTPPSAVHTASRCTP